MEEPAHNCPAKQNVTITRSVRHSGRAPSVQTLQNKAVSLLWSHIQLAHRKLSAQHDAIISILATQLTLRIKAPRPIPRQRWEGGSCKATGIHPRTAQHPHVYKQVNNISTSYATWGFGVGGSGGWYNEEGDERQGKWAHYSVAHVKRGGWLRKKEKLKAYQFWALLCRCHSCEARQRRGRRQRKKVTNRVCSPCSD